MTPLEAEARAYVEPYCDKYSSAAVTKEIRYLIALIEALDARDAEIARLTAQLHSMKVEFQDEDTMTALHAEIARLREAVAMLRQVEQVLRDDTNALDHPCCGWGPLYGEIKVLADKLEGR